VYKLEHNMLTSYQKNC